MERNLIDVSQHQGNINWKKVKDSGIDYAILRIGWIGNNKQEIDSKFEKNYAEARANEINVGGYVYNYAKSKEKISEGANWVLNIIKNKKFQLPIYIDMEDDSLIELGKSTLTNFCIYFNTIIESSGRWTGVYANKNWFTNYLDYKLLKSKYTLWLAQYSSKKSLECDIWQYSESGTVNGISDNKVDLNIIYRDLVSEIIGEDMDKEIIDNEIEFDNNEEVENLEMPRVYQNGSTVENVYSDTDLKNKIGSLNPNEKAEYLSIDNDRPLVRYKIDGTNVYKCGYVNWKGGCK